MTLEHESSSDLPARTSVHYDLISAVLGFFVFGSWAYFVNWAGGREGAGPWVSGLTQGVVSFLVTLVMVRAAAWLYHRTSHLRAGLDRLLPVVIIVLVTGACMALAHALVGTPQITKTISPGLGIAFVFNLFTVTKLRRMGASVQP